MKNTIRNLFLLFLGLIIIVACMASKVRILTTKHQGQNLIGKWQGKQNMCIRYKKGILKYSFVNSPFQLPTTIIIQADGMVNGSIGDAKFQNACVVHNRGPLLRKLGWASDFAINGNLIGNLFEEDSLLQKTFSIPIQCDSTQLSGDIFLINGIDMFPMGTIQLKRTE